MAEEGEAQGALRGRTRAALTAGYFATFVVFGMGVSALGPALPSLAQNTGSTLSRVSAIITAGASGFLLGALAGGRLFARLPGHWVLGGVLALTAGAAALIPVASSLWLLTLLFLLLGTAQGLVEVGGNSLILWVHADRPGPYVNALHFFFGVGALLAPAGVALALSATGKVAWFYWAFALLALAVTGLILALPSPRRPEEGGDVRGGRGLARSAALLVALAALFYLLYAGIEHGFGDWIASYAQVRKMASAARAALLVSAFWAAITAGRFLAVPVSARVPPHTILAAALVGALLSVAVVLVWPSVGWVLWLGTVGLGLSLAPIFPTMLALMGRRAGVSAQAASWYFAGSGVGKMTVPWTIGQLLESAGPQSLFVVVGLLLVAALVLFAVLNGIQAPRKEPDAAS